VLLLLLLLVLLLLLLLRLHSQLFRADACKNLRNV
jgi:hypothetical protein